MKKTGGQKSRWIVPLNVGSGTESWGCYSDNSLKNNQNIPVCCSGGIYCVHNVRTVKTRKKNVSKTCFLRPGT